MKSNKQIGEILRKIRKERGISQIAIAEKIGVSFQQIQKYEKGSTAISVERLQQLTAALDVKESLFLNDDNDTSEIIKEKEAHYISYKFLSPEEAEIIKLLRKLNNKKITKGILLTLQGICISHKKKEK